MEEETGWKLVHGDVFRPPALPMLLSVFVGTGVQTLAMSIITMCFAVLGFLSPANRGGLMTAMLMLFVFMGVINGYVTGRMLRGFALTDWQGHTLKTALAFPSVVFAVVFALNLLVWGRRSAAAVPFLSLIHI